MREQKQNNEQSVMRTEPASVARAEAFAVSGSRRKEDIPRLMEALRRHIERIEGGQPQLASRHQRSEAWRVGLSEIDAHLAPAGLSPRGLHDIAPQAYGDMPAAMGFAVALALRRLADRAERRPLLWCRLAREEREYGRLYGHGLESLGLGRERFVTVTLKHPVALMWTMEEALKSAALALVIADADPRAAGLTATRRLALAAEAGKAAGLLVFCRPHADATASLTRWTVASSPSRAPPDDGQSPGVPSWTIELTRARGGRPGRWTVEWQHAPHRFALVSGLRDRALHPWTDESRALPPAAGPAFRAG